MGTEERLAAALLREQKLREALQYTVATLDNIIPVIVSELGDDDGEAEEVMEMLVPIRALLATPEEG